MDMIRVRILQMKPEIEVDFCVFPALWQAALPARITAVTGVPPNGGQGADLASEPAAAGEPRNRTTGHIDKPHGAA
jgi:hypothetical protein